MSAGSRGQIGHGAVGVAHDTRVVTVFIPTFNGAHRLREVIDAVLTQELPPDHSLELLIIDSGSTDDTLAIIAGYRQIRLHTIPNREFSHGATRALAARLARGEFVLFLTQDATPVHGRWLINLIEPFFLSDLIGCVYGAQRPRPNAALTIKREVSSAFPGAPETIVVSRARSLVDQRAEWPINNFFSDVNSAARRELLTGDVPFRSVAYAEDQALAQDMQARGYLKAYAVNAPVWHANEFGPFAYHGRKLAEYTGLSASTGHAAEETVLSLLLGWLKPTLLDWRFLLVDSEYTVCQKCRQAVLAPLYNIAAKSARFRAYRPSSTGRR